MSNKVKNKLMIAGAAFCAVLFFFSGMMLCREFLDQKQSVKAFAEVAGLVTVSPKPEEDASPEGGEQPVQLSGYGEYEVVAAFKTTAYSEDGFKYYRFIQAADAAEFDAFIEKCKELAFYDTGVSAGYGDTLLTLSTCEYSRKNGRMVVVARKIAE